MWYIIITLLIYIASFIGAYNYIRIAHSKGGIWYGLDTTKSDIFIVFCPGLNSFVAIDLVFSCLKQNTKKTYNSFFHIKK